MLVPKKGRTKPTKQVLRETDRQFDMQMTVIALFPKHVDEFKLFYFKVWHPWQMKGVFQKSPRPHESVLLSSYKKYRMLLRHNLLYIQNFKAVCRVVTGKDKSCVKSVTFHIKHDKFGTSHTLPCLLNRHEIM